MLASVVEAAHCYQEVQLAVCEWNAKCRVAGGMRTLAITIQQDAAWRINSGRIVLAAKLLKAVVKQWRPAISRAILQSWSHKMVLSRSFHAKLAMWKMRT